eukprot:gnl/TRDRNA2_/TRDRNA2_172159_c7_seq1.p1 gnl/TRDRNA2_/TRDRNA2_172159_c7~~gnl/TRDRNA2_/TRDRNA2_172159_c7_seq1.p1  ORF type:complete len:153 (+),score=6.67 gnl/TRDRNA2_/TRDRNA2_172159_c7_seq1:14-472(+)
MGGNERVASQCAESAHNMFERPCILKSHTRLSAAVHKCLSECSTIENADATLWPPSSAVSTLSSDCFTPSAWLISCSLDLPMPISLCSAALANILSSFSSDHLTVANAHDILARFYAWNSSTRHSDCLANAPNSFFSEYFTAAYAHAMRARS